MIALGPLVRIIMRYGTGALVANGFIDVETADLISGDADIQEVMKIALGALIMIITEGYYWLSKRHGWTT